ncbi:MAG: glycosyltransferase family 2 protein [Gemmatimonadaceae bacterium]|nr:glycosyltransferase family 2 protein [Gemmatimonadaceae bacterium]
MGEPPQLSVIVPVHDGGPELLECLTALRASDIPPREWELIVVDDSSTDRSVELASRFADRLVALDGGARGPAYARNRGVDAALGSVLVFVDSDVSVHPDALRLLQVRLARDPSIAAVFGSYDDRPSHPSFVSQYRNLLHHYVHQRNAGDAQSFWAGCGAVRRDAFAGAGAFDEERYSAAQIEDVELGYRLRDRGGKLFLDPAVLGTHHKKWTFGRMLRADFFSRGVPWTRLLLERGELVSGRGASLGASAKASVIVTALAWLFAVMAALDDPRWLAASAASLLCLSAVNADLLVWFANRRGWAFALRGIPMLVLYNSISLASAGAGYLAHLLSARSRARSS